MVTDVQQLEGSIAHALDDVTDAYVVGNLDNDPERLPFWGRLFVKYICIPLEAFAHRRWGWSCNPQFQTVCKTFGSAELMCEGRRRWFWSKVPVEPRVLPDEPLHYGHSFPASQRAAKYDRLSPQTVQYSLDEMARVTIEAERLKERLEQGRA